VILGKGRHRILAICSILELIISATRAMLVAESRGLAGVCLAVAIPGAFFRGICPLVFACRMLGVPVGLYVRRAFFPSVLVAAGPVFLLGLVSSSWTPGNWAELCLCGGMYTTVYVAVAGVGLFGGELRQRFPGWLRRANEEEECCAVSCSALQAPVPRSSG